MQLGRPGVRVRRNGRWRVWLAGAEQLGCIGRQASRQTAGRAKGTYCMGGRRGSEAGRVKPGQGSAARRAVLSVTPSTGVVARCSEAEAKEDKGRMCVGGTGRAKEGTACREKAHAGRKSTLDGKGARWKRDFGLWGRRRTWERRSHAHGDRCKVRGWAERATWNGLARKRIYQTRGGTSKLRIELSDCILCETL